MDLLEKYNAADEAEARRIDKIVSAFKSFAAQTPAFKNTEQNRSRLFQIMEQMREESGLNPNRASDWSEAHAEFLYEYDRQPTPNQQPRRATVKRGPTHADIEKMSSREYQRRMESDPAFEAQVNALVRK